MHEMRDHRVSLAVDLLLARMMEVKLLQLVACSADGDRTAGRVVDLDRMSVVDDMQRRGAVCEIYLRQVCRFRSPNVDGRLMLAQFTGSKVLVELAPVARAFRAPVGPMR